jgi:hypothetical protein
LVSIYEALYKEEISHELIDIKDLNPVTYNEKYKGNLYCTTKHCSAKLSYVSRNGISDHFRTWRESPHIETCLYYFEKNKSRGGRRTEGLISSTASDERIKRSLREAFALEMMSDEQKQKRLERDRERRRAKRDREKIRGTKDLKPEQRIVSNPQEIDETTSNDSFRLFKKNADNLQGTDIGQTRTVTGKFKKVGINNITNVVVQIEKNTINVDIKFEEAFFAVNDRYIGLFPYLDRYHRDNAGMIFSATGEVRYSEITERYEIVVYTSVGFLIHGKSLESIAADYAIRDNDIS